MTTEAMLTPPQAVHARPTLQDVIQATPPAPTTPQRLVSLDIFRGITIAAMLLVNNSGKGTPFGPLEHADWHGWTPTDLIFPFFLFIVGVAIPFSLAKRAARSSKLAVLGSIWLRALSLVLLGALLQAIPSLPDALPDGYTTLHMLRFVAIIYTILGVFAVLFPWKRSAHWNWIIPAIGVGLWLLMVAIHVANKHAYEAGLASSFNFGGGALTPWKYRIPGVLQRIGICYGIAATVALFSGWRTALLTTILLFTAYSILMFKAPFPAVEYKGVVHNHVVGSLTEEDNLARRIDEKIFRTHNYAHYPDNEGLLSTLPAIGSVLLGICIGYWLRTNRPLADRAAGVLAMGVVVTILGCCLNSWLMPINKNIWTPSFTVFAAGMGMLGLGAVFWFVDCLGYRRWALPFRIYGMNAIAAFVAASLISKVGSMIRFDDPFTKKNISVTVFCMDRAAAAVHQLSAFLQQHIPHFPPIDNPGMTSLAYSLGFVIFVWLLLSVMYAFKVFVKV